MHALHSERYPMIYRVNLKRHLLSSDVPAQYKSVAGVSRNLSYSGLGLRVTQSELIYPGEELLVTLWIDESSSQNFQKIIFAAKVIWKKKHYCGLQITFFKKNNHDTYRKLVEGFELLTHCTPISGS